MAKVNVFAYKSYRAFLQDWLRENGLSYRAFVAKYPQAISLIALAKLLSRGRSGVEEKSAYRISPEALARLGRVLRLSPAEVKHLVLLRLENDADVMKGQFGNAFQQSMRELLADNQKPMRSARVSDVGALLSEIIDILPMSFRKKIIEEALLQGKIYASRQSAKPGIKTLQSLLRSLSNFKEIGSA